MKIRGFAPTPHPKLGLVATGEVVAPTPHEAPKRYRKPYAPLGVCDRGVDEAIAGVDELATACAFEGALKRRIAATEEKTQKKFKPIRMGPIVPDSEKPPLLAAPIDLFWFWTQQPTLVISRPIQSLRPSVPERP